MGTSKCSICQKKFLPRQKIVRVLIEAVSRDGDDGNDSDYWSKVHDWEVLSKAHLLCVARSLNQGLEFPYSEECWDLPIDDLVEELLPPPESRLKIVQGGLS
jgi:hypothetical protein